MIGPEFAHLNPISELKMRDVSISSPLNPLRRTWARAALATLAAVTVGDLHFWSMLAGGSWVPQAHAQASVNSTLAVVVVPGPKKGADDAEALERLLGEAVSRLDTVRPFELSPLANNENEVAAAELIEDALRALLLRTPKRAQERLMAAAAKLKEAPQAGDERLYARLYKAQGLALLAVGDLVPARDMVVKSLVLVRAQKEEEYAAYGSQARELFAAVAPNVQKGATGDLKVVTRGGKADIWIDGDWRGTGTAQASSLPAGTHRITVRQGGQIAERRFVEVAAGKTVAAEFDLKAAPFSSDLEQGRSVLATNFKQPSVVEDRTRELRNQLGADQMLVLRPTKDKKVTGLQGYFLGADGSFKKVEANITMDENYFDHLGEFLAETVGAKLGPDIASTPLDQRQSVVVQGAGARRAGADQIDPNAPIFEDEKTKKKSVFSQWWFWTAVVAGAGLVGGGLYYLSKGGPDSAAGAVGTVQVKLFKAGAP